MALIDLKNPKGMLTGIVLFVVALAFLPVLVPIALVAIVNLSTIANMPFSSFFASGGAVVLAFGAAIVLGVIGSVLIAKSGKGR